MNLQELDELIAAIPKDDIEMIEYYTKKRAELAIEVSEAINAILGVSNG